MEQMAQRMEAAALRTEQAAERASGAGSFHSCDVERPGQKQQPQQYPQQQPQPEPPMLSSFSFANVTAHTRQSSRTKSPPQADPTKHGNQTQPPPTQPTRQAKIEMSVNELGSSLSKWKVVNPCYTWLTTPDWPFEMFWSSALGSPMQKL